MPMPDVVDLTRRLVRERSVTAVDPKDLPASLSCLDILQRELRQAGFRVHRKQWRGGHEKWGYPVENLYAEIDLGRPDNHVCYLGHIDVVPVGDRKAWQVDPFAGVEKDGYLYGRGTTDMKGSVAAFTVAAIEAAKSGQIKNQRLSLLITSDEEWAAVNGTDRMLGWVKDELGRELDQVIVGEPSSQDQLGTGLKVGRRGSLVGKLVARGTQGHAAYPDLFENPNRALNLALTILNAHEFKDGSEIYPNTGFEPVAMRGGSPTATAVIPGTAEAVWNIRFTPEHTGASLRDWIKQSLANPPAWAQSHPDVGRLQHIEVVANLDTVSIPYATKPAALAAALQDATTDELGSAPKLDAFGGTTDGRFVHRHFPEAEVIEMGPPERGGIIGQEPPADYGQRGGMHQVDERISIADLRALTRIYQGALVKLSHHLKKTADHDRLGVTPGPSQHPPKRPAAANQPGSRPNRQAG
ncbi:MAG: succinyl-diaminopimelate desuccinylase [Pseudomonadota bacterium]